MTWYFFIPFTLFVLSSTIFLARNPVYGVLAFVAVVAHVVVLLIALNVEFLAYVLAIVYIGAIVVLFLFVIMMFYLRQNVNKQNPIFGMLKYIILGISVALAVSIYSFFRISEYVDYAITVSSIDFVRLIAYLLFNDWALLTVLAALLMFIGILGAIILTIKSSSSATSVPTRIRSRVQDSIVKNVRK